MSRAQIVEAPFVTSVFHPSDFSEASRNAFAHALAIALFRQTDFIILHSGRDFLGEDEWTKFPPVRKTLEKWKLLEPGSPRSAIFDELAVRVKKVNLRSLSPLSAALDYLDRHPTDLIVLATEGRDGPPSWIRPSKAERLARRTETMTLFVPNSAPGFVGIEDGEVTLRRILVPVDERPDPRSAIAYATRAAQLAAGDPVEILLLHVGDGAGIPVFDLPDAPACSFQKLQRSGDVAEQILGTAREHAVDLIAMTTEGHDGILDALRGSVTEQVLRGSPCPLLAVPAD